MKAVFSKHPTPSKGSALILALWAIVLLSLMVGAMAFNMHLEARLTTHHRARFKAAEMAKAGVSWAQFLLYKGLSAFNDESVYGENIRISAINLSRGLAVSGMKPLEQLGGMEGSFSVDIIPEQGRWNVNHLTKDEWDSIFERAGIPDDQWDELADALMDWVDENDLHRLNGAEEDDDFYSDVGYEVKNAPIDTIDELLLIKGFSQSILYGGPGENEGDPPIQGIAKWLTTFGNGKLNINAASRELLFTLPGVDEYMVDRIMEGRAGPDGAMGTEDDGFTSVGQAIAYAGLPDGLAGRLDVRERRYIRIVSVGEYESAKVGVWSIFLQEGRNLMPVFWREEPMQ